MIIEKMRGLAEISGLNCDDLDVEFGELLPEYGRGALHGVLGGAVNGEAGIAVQAGHAAHVDDAA